MSVRPGYSKQAVRLKMEVVVPVILAGIEKARQVVSQRIERGQVSAFVVIAAPTYAGEDFECGLTAVLAGDDVINFGRIKG